MKTTKIRLAALLISGATVCAALTGCATTPKSTATNQNESSATPQTDTSSLLLQIEHYEEIINDLEERLLSEKEANYIIVGAYKQTIAELETNIELLNKKIDILSKPNQQESSIPELKEQVALTPNTNNNQTSSEFVCNGNVIAQYKGAEGTIRIPDNINGTIITQIGEGAFTNCNAEKIIIPGTIEYIDWFAFSGCKNLTEIYIPASVTSIAYGAFDGCSSFLVIKCPKGSYAEAYARSWGIIVITE